MVAGMEGQADSHTPQMKTKTIIGISMAILSLAFVMATFAQTSQLDGATLVTTNALPPPGLLDTIPGLNLLPEKWRGWVLALVALSPFLGRAYYSIRTGGGFMGIARALWFGTNVPKPAEPPKQVDPPKV